MSSRPSVLVVGAGGFVGRHLVPALSAHGYAVRAATREGSGAGEVRLDVTDADSVRRAFETGPPPEAVVHLAAIAHRPRGGVAPGAYDAVNHRGAEAVARAAREAGVRRFVLFSSAAVYGDEGRTGPVREDAELRPRGAYAVSKRDAESAVFAVADGGMDAVALRFPAIYAADWLLDVRKRAYVPGTGGRLLLRVPGRPPRYSLCAVQHAADAVELALSGALGAGPCNVADPGPYTQAQVARAVGAMDGRRVGVPVPRVLLRLATAAAGVAPAGVAAAVRENYWKLFEGLVLDTTRVEAAGFRGRTTLLALAGVAE